MILCEIRPHPLNAIVRAGKPENDMGYLVLSLRRQAPGNRNGLIQ